MSNFATLARRRALRSKEELPLVELFPRMVDVLAPATIGRASIDHIEVTEQQAAIGNLRASLSPGGHLMRVLPGRYARLSDRGVLQMTDTPMERRSNHEFARKAHGRVFIAGLGLGMIVHAAARRADVERVTIVESSADVIALVAPSLLATYGDRVEIIEGDAFTWSPAKGRTFNTIYFDIWPTISSDNLPEMGRLLRRAAAWKDRSDPDLWVGCWMREFLRATSR